MYAYEIENFKSKKLRRTSWEHPEAFWYFSPIEERWVNQKGIDVERHLNELFNCNDWEESSYDPMARYIVEVQRPDGKKGRILTPWFSGINPMEFAESMLPPDHKVLSFTSTGETFGRLGL